MSVLLRSIVLLIAIVAVVTDMTVPSAQFATHAVAPDGESETAVGSDPTATSAPFTGAAPFSPVILTSF